MADKFELTDAAPVAPNGKTNVRWQSDVSGNISAYVEVDKGVHIIQDEGVALATFDTLNFAGAGVTASVDTPGARITVTIPGGSQTPWSSAIDAAGFSLSNTGTVAIGNDGTPPFVYAPAFHGLTIGPQSTYKLTNLTLCSYAGDAPVAQLTFANYAISGSDKRIAQMICVHEGAGSGYLQFDTINAGAFNSAVLKLTAAGAAEFAGLAVFNSTVKMFLGGTLKTLSVDGSGFVKAT